MSNTVLPLQWDPQLTAQERQRVEAYTATHPSWSMETVQNTFYQNGTRVLVYRWGLQEMEDMLSLVGSKCVMTTQPPEHPFYGPTSPIIWQLWIHPDGMVVCVKAQPGHSGGPDVVMNIDVLCVVDVGRSSINALAQYIHTEQCTSRKGVLSSGGAMLFKTWYHNQSPGDFSALLKKLENAGALVPVEEWERHGFRSTLPITLLEFASAPSYPTDPTDPQWTSIIQDAWDRWKAWDSDPNIPPSLKRCIQRSLTNTTSAAASSNHPLVKKIKEITNLNPLEMDAATPHEMEWGDMDACCEHLNKVAETVLRDPYPSITQSSVLLAWCNQIIAPQPQHVDWSSWTDWSTRTDTQSSLGEAVAVTVVNSAKEPLDKWNDLLNHVPQEVLIDWCTVPNAAGHTLPMVLMSLALSNPGRFEMVEIMLKDLVHRLPSSGRQLQTSQQTLPGMWWRARQRHLGQPATSKTTPVFRPSWRTWMSMMDTCRQQGWSVDQDLRCPREIMMTRAPTEQAIDVKVLPMLSSTLDHMIAQETCDPELLSQWLETSTASFPSASTPPSPRKM